MTRHDLYVLTSTIYDYDYIYTVKDHNDQLFIDSEFVYIVKPSESKEEYFIQQQNLKRKSIKGRDGTPMIEFDNNKIGKTWGPYPSLTAACVAYTLLKATS